MDILCLILNKMATEFTANAILNNCLFLWWNHIDDSTFQTNQMNEHKFKTFESIGFHVAEYGLLVYDS